MKHAKIGLNQKILLLMGGTFLLTFSLCVLSFMRIFYSREQSETEQALRESFRRIENRVDSYIDETDLASNTVMCSTWVQQLYANTDAGSSLQVRTNRSNAERFLSCFASMYDELDCFIVLEDGSYLKNNNSYLIDMDYRLEDQDFFDTLTKQQKYRLFGHNPMFTKKIQDRSVTTYFVIKSIYNLKPIGYFVTNIRYDTFRFLDKQLGSGEDILIRDLNGNVVFTSQEDPLFSAEPEPFPGTMTNGRDSMVLYDRILDGNWEVWIRKAKSPLVESMKKYIWLFLLLIPVFIMFPAASLLTSRYLTKPIVLCTNALHEIRKENYNIQIPNRYTDEIGDMIDGFNDMSANIGHLLDLNQAMYRSRLETEFRILQQRINPHFLRNTLEIINGMILCGETDKALELSGMLGQMYRYDIGEKDVASIAEELEYLKVYLSILSYKYRDLHVQYEIDDRCLDFMIPKFVCQPLVENTLKHGFSDKAGPYRIDISVKYVDVGAGSHAEASAAANVRTGADPDHDSQEKKKEGEEGRFVRIRIADNGSGMDARLLADLSGKIQMLKEDQTIPIEEHIGMLNTARRLFLYYGKACVFTVESEVGEGTRILIDLPDGAVGGTDERTDAVVIGTTDTLTDGEKP